MTNSSTCVANEERFIYDEDLFEPVKAENRYLEEVRHSLLNRNVSGSDVIYTIAMDVGKKKDQLDLSQRGLLYGMVEYAAGKLGNEPIKSQEHIHAISKISKMFCCRSEKRRHYYRSSRLGTLHYQ